MNQEQVVRKLLELDSNVEDFIVTFSGKKSKKVDGLYKPETREIIIHNHNFTEDNALIYTAIHEFAHHIQFTKSNVSVSARAHTSHFWNIFHKLLFLAEEKNIYNNIFRKEERFTDLTKRIKEQFLTANGRLMKEFGSLLMQAYELCTEFGASFEDYVDRELQLHRSTAKTLMKFNSFDINPEIGYENMKIVAGIREPEVRVLAEEAFAIGKSPDMVRAEFFAAASPLREDSNMLENLLLRKEQIEKNIEKLTSELASIEEKINEIR
ncbi:MAG: hypothetical protein JW864_01465 [Spirochaetes bacterium]|nr:hypothetical protein [Spirochaetota bacterium]